MIQQLLFPWKGTIRRLELGKRWWHRLAVVVFFVVLIATLLVTWYRVGEFPIHVEVYMPDGG
jgi:hypothetical protein